MNQLTLPPSFPEAIEFARELHREFGQHRQALLTMRQGVQDIQLNKGYFPDFEEDGKEIREDMTWKVAPCPGDLMRRRVEITGPTDRKMIINAMNSGADVFMADFEDALSPTWDNILQGQINLYETVRRTISFQHSRKGLISLNAKTAALLVRPRGWHLEEAHVHVDGQPISASIFDFAVYFFLNAKELIARGSGPYFYLAKLESPAEAALWNAIFTKAQKMLGIPHGTVRATMLIENILATFQAEEMLYYLRDHASGLNVGRWDYIASFLKKFRMYSKFVAPDRGQISMEQPFLRAYTDHIVRVCHRRGAHAIGGMAAQIPVKDNPEANQAALAKVRTDKKREVKQGFDGTWVAHPELVSIAQQEFQEHLGDKPNQLDHPGPDGTITAQDLLRVPLGFRTEAGLREVIIAFVGYVSQWFRGNGAVPLAYTTKDGQLYAYLMEDAATAEIARTQLWQWYHHKAHLVDGRLIDLQLIGKLMGEVMEKMAPEKPERDAALLLMALIRMDGFPDYLTLPAYPMLLEQETKTT